MISRGVRGAGFPRFVEQLYLADFLAIFEVPTFPSNTSFWSPGDKPAAITDVLITSHLRA